MSPQVFQVHAFFDRSSSTLSYLLWDSVTSDAVILDPVLGFDPATQMTSLRNLEPLINFVRGKGLVVHWILETHAHADHLSAARELKREWPTARWGIGEALSEVFENFRKVLAWPPQVKLSQLGVDRWLRDGEELSAGSLRLQALRTPGHTPACLTYKIGESLFTGDALMMPDAGTGRCDFPGGSASQLYDSVWTKLYSFPDHFKDYVGHDYQPGARPLCFQTTIGAQRANNIHLNGTTSKSDFVSFRDARDRTLSGPRLLTPSLDWNLGAHQVVKLLN